MRETARELSVAMANATDPGQEGRLTDRLSAQLHRMTAANGKVIDTLIGTLGANPRKGVTRTETQLIYALLEVAIDALTAIQIIELERRNRAGAGGALANKLARVAIRAGVAPEDAGTDEDALSYGWRCLLAISSWVDTNNGHRDQEARLWGRVSKVAEELGEASTALLELGSTSGPEKNHLDVFTEETLDVAVAALGAAEHISHNRGHVLDTLIEEAKSRAVRSSPPKKVTGAEIREALRAPRCGFTHTVHPARRH